MLGGSVQRIADDAAPGACDTLVDKLFVAFLLYKDSRPGTAALALIEEQPLVGAFDRLLQIRIGEDDVGTFAAKLQRDALQIGLRGSFHHQAARFGSSGEGYLVYVQMAGDRGASAGTVSR